MLFYCSIMVKCITRPVRDVVIFGIIVKYGTRQVRDVDIMQYYDRKYETLRPPPPHTHLNFTNLLWARSTSVRDVITNNIF